MRRGERMSAKEPVADGIRRLCAWASGLEVAAVPEPIRRRAALVLAVGYELCGRFARGFRFAELVLHPHASLAAVGAATGVAALRRLDAATFLAAVTAASTMVAPGPFNHAVLGALVRNVWPAAGAW